MQPGLVRLVFAVYLLYGGAAAAALWLLAAGAAGARSYALGVVAVTGSLHLTALAGSALLRPCWGYLADYDPYPLREALGLYLLSDFVLAGAVGAAAVELSASATDSAALPVGGNLAVLWSFALCAWKTRALLARAA